MAPATFAFFFFNDTATTEIYTLSLHDALPIYIGHDRPHRFWNRSVHRRRRILSRMEYPSPAWRSEEHTSELQSHLNLVCRLLLEKKKQAASYTCVSCARSPICARTGLFGGR